MHGSFKIQALEVDPMDSSGVNASNTTINIEVGREVFQVIFVRVSTSSEGVATLVPR